MDPGNLMGLFPYFCSEAHYFINNTIGGYTTLPSRASGNKRVY